jgi:hypothetical protein
MIWAKNLNNKTCVDVSTEKAVGVYPEQINAFHALAFDFRNILILTSHLRVSPKRMCLITFCD